MIRKIEELVGYDRNPRINNKAVYHVLESLKRHGQVKPIVISEAGFPFTQEIICCGHTTVDALKKFGAKEVKVVVKQFDSEADFVNYNIVDNKSGEHAEWDESLLIELANDFDIDLNEMGFDLGNIEEDFSDKNEEIDLDGLDDDCELKIKFSAEIYEKVIEALRIHGESLDQALLKVLNIES